jgi:hypothetical protein
VDAGNHALDQRGLAGAGQPGVGGDPAARQEGSARGEEVIVTHFEIVGAIADVESIAIGPRIRELPRLKKLYGPGRWRKMKGIAVIRLPSGKLRRTELHWYESHGIGRKEWKIKRYLDVRHG